VITYANMGQAGARLDIHNLDDPGAIFLDHFAMDMPAVREDTSDRPRGQGMNDYTEFFGARTIEMTGVIFSSNLSQMADYLDELTAAFSLWGSAQKQITFQRLGRDYKEFCNVRLGDFSAPVDVPGNEISWSASLVAADPRIYRRHTPDPATISFKSHHTITNTGSGINAPVVIRIVGPAKAGSGVRNSSLDVERSFTITRDIGRGSVLEIDTLARTVTLNGKRANELLNPEAWFWKLRPGTNRIQRTGKMDGHIEVDWREARI
jgi:Phage tail protein